MLFAFATSWVNTYFAVAIPMQSLVIVNACTHMIFFLADRSNYNFPHLCAYGALVAGSAPDGGAITAAVDDGISNAPVIVAILVLLPVAIVGNIW